MTSETVDRAIEKAKDLLSAVRGGSPTHYEPIIEAIRAYAKGEGDADNGALLAYRMGRVTGNYDQDAIMILLSLINLRAPGATQDEKDAARQFVFPSTWDWLSQ